MIPENGPIFVDEWLRERFQFARGERKTMTGERYAILIHEVAAPAVRRRYPGGQAIWQDDGATIHRTQEVLVEVNRCFSERIPIAVQCAKFDDCWPIENVWGIVRERLQGKQFETLELLKERIV